MTKGVFLCLYMSADCTKYLVEHLAMINDIFNGIILLDTYVLLKFIISEFQNFAAIQDNVE